MKAPIALIFSVLLSSSSKYLYVVTHVDAFCSVVPVAVPSAQSIDQSASFGISITSYMPTSLNSLNDDTNDNGNGNDNDNENQIDNNKNNIRKARMEKESMNSNSNSFASGEELKSLREDLKSLKQNLEWAKASKDDVRIESLEKAIHKGESRDPSFMYAKSKSIINEVQKMKDATEDEKKIIIEKWSTVAAVARELLPHLNMEGLWVGNYGEAKGLQVVNITYSGDELIATKVTGDVNVPRGERSFTVNVQPSNSSALPPVKLISEQNGNGEFRRFPGKGQVSRKGFKDNRFVEGQMILFENGFSFVWIPTKHHVLFHRPTPEMTLKLLRNTISKEDEVENMRNHLSRCYDMDLSTAIARQQDPGFTVDEPLRRITTQEELEQAEERLKQSDSDRGNIFFQIGKWRNYIDQVLDKKSSSYKKSS